MNEFQRWLGNLASRPSVAWRWSLNAEGTCRRHTGPSLWYAAVQLQISPSDDFAVDDQLEVNVREYSKNVGWYDQIIFGVFDVLMVHATAPFRSFKLTILGIDFNDIESNEMAFRLAARDAAAKILQETLSSDIADAGQH